jgi:hypothetical protein
LAFGKIVGFKEKSYNTDFSLEVKWNEPQTYHSQLSSVEVKNEWSYNFIPPYRPGLMVCRGTPSPLPHSAEIK